MKAEPSSPMCIEPVSGDLAAALSQFAPISLGDMDSVSLMRRVDTKYIIHQGLLPLILGSVADKYAILEINRRRIMRYASQYYDTAACQFYIDHHNRKAKRTKVRIRHYVDAGISFLEIKQKNVKGVTSKSRTRFAPTETELSVDARRFIDETTGRIWDLHPTIRNRFRRLTLVDTDRSERVTIDWDLSSHLERIEYPHTNLVIIEVKQEGVDRHAPVMQSLKSIGARPYRVSKYCLGMSCLCPHLKSNRFKQRLRRISKVTSATPN